MNRNRNKSCEVELTVPFHDLDIMQLVWHGNYFKYFDIARFALFDSLGVDFEKFYKKIRCFFPIVKTSTKHIVPLRHRDKFICTATIIEAHIMIVIDFEIRLVKSGEVCTKGRSEQVAVKYPEMEMMLAIPDEMRTALVF